MRSSFLPLATMLALACTPQGDERATTDTTAVAPPAVVPDTGRTAADSAAPPTATPSATTPRSPRADRADSTATRTPRIAPPTKAPGGYRMVPNPQAESLRMARPESTARRP